MNRDNSDRKVLLGYGVIFLGLIQYIVIVLILPDKSELSFISSISFGVIGGCVAEGISMIKRGRDPKKDKQAQVESQDERNQLIKGKAAYIAFIVTIIMVILLSYYFRDVMGNELAYWLCFGVFICGGIVYGIAYKLYGRKI